MASKKKGGRGNDYDWDDDLDFDLPDFGGDNPAGISDDRKPITKGLKSAAAGFGKSFTNEARLRKTLTNSLPREYQEPISKAFEIKNGVRDLYNITSSEVSETVRESKRSVNRIARNLESSIPKGVYEKIMRMTEDKSAASAGPSKEEIENNSINSAITDMLGETAKMDADNRKKDQAQRIVQDSIDKKRHADMTAILGSIDQSLIALQTYQEKVGTNYMKKSLEIQMRSYFVQNDMLQLQSKFFQQFKDDLSAITKNTGLPDFVKKATKEALMERLREKTFDSLTGSLAKRRNEWMGGVVKKAGDKIKGIGANIRDGASQIFDTVESVSSMAGSGMGPDGSEILGDIAGGAAGGKVQDAIAKKLLAFVRRNPNALKTGNKLSMIANNLPQWVNKQMNTGKHADKIPDWLKDILKLDGESSSVKLNKEVDLDRAAQFSDKNSRSLNIVIPELLSKIHHELYVTRTGDTKSKPLTYDYEKGKLVSSKERQSILKEQLVPKATVERSQAEIGDIFKQIDPDGTKFDKKARDKIATNIYAANKRGEMFDREGMMKAAGHDGFADAIRDHIGVDPNAVKERALSSSFGKLGARNGEIKEHIQDLINQGRHGELAQMGLLDLKTGQINMEKVRRMELGLDNNGTVASAKGNIFNNGNVQAFAKGGVFGNFSNKVVDKTTAFPMANGKTGIMGEAGPEAIMPLKRDRQGRLGIRTEKGMGDKVLVQIRDILSRIEEKGGMGGMGGMMSPEQLAEYVKGQGSNLWGKATGLLGKFGSMSKNHARRGRILAKRTGRLVGKGLTTGKNWLMSKKDQFDLYIDGEVTPRLDKAKLEAGRYYDVNSKKIITKFEDITGDVKDLDTDQIVLKYTEMKNIVLKNLETGKTVLASSLTWTKKAIIGTFKKAQEAAGKIIGLGKSAYGMAWAGVKKAYDMLTDGPMDVYLKSSPETPALLKRIMEQGLYHDQATLDTITKVSQIKGPVVDNQNNVLITREQLAEGLYDKNGQEIKTGFDRITQFVGNSIKKTIGTYKKLLGKGKELGGKALEWMKGLLGGESPFTFSSRKNADILAAIYNLLNDRLPGERSPDLEHIPSSGGAGISNAAGSVAKGAGKLYAKAKEKATTMRDKARDRINGLRDEHEDSIRIKANGLIDVAGEKARNGKAKIKDKWGMLYNLMAERLPKLKDKVKGDTDGDGVRDGSFDDLRSKRQKIKDAVSENANKLGDKVKGTSAYAQIADFFKKKKKDGEEEEGEEKKSLLDQAREIFGEGEDDGGGDDEKSDKEKARDKKRKRRLARMRPQGRMGKLMGGAKNLLGKIPGAGKIGELAGKVAGSGVGRAGGLLGRVAGVAGRGALALGGSLIGGGLSSAGLVTGGLSMLGSVLGVAGTAIGAILSSPILVPALLTAAAGTAGYFAYKWLTSPDPQPIEKVRLVQYGFKADDVEAYKRMKTLEQKVAGCVSFSGEKAEFDSKKLNIQDMMKVYGLDPTNKDHAQKFIDWFAGRFRPVYLNHRALIKTTASPKELPDVDDNKAEFKKTYLEQCLFPGEHYSVTINPTKDVGYLYTSQGTVERQIETAKAEVAKAGDKKPEDKTKTAATTAVALAAADAKKEEAKKQLEAEKKKDEDRGSSTAKSNLSPETQAKMNRLKAATTGLAANAGLDKGAGGDNPIDRPAGPNGEAGPPKSKPGVKPKSGDALKVKESLIKQMPKFGITTPNQQAALLGNVDHESGFQPISENLNYKPSALMKLWPKRFPNQQVAGDVASKGPQGIANSIYGNRMGNTDANDGWDYRGRGPMQLTGKANYAAVSKLIGTNIVDDPDKLITDPDASAASALAYWKMNPALGKNADAGNFLKVRQIINGGNIGADDALARTQEYLDKIKKGDIKLDGTSSSASGGTGVATDSSVKPSTDAVASSPNSGPAPSSFSPPKAASPRPASDSSGSAAPMAPVRSATSDPFYQKQSSVNSGDSMEIMKKSNDELVKHTGFLERIAIGMEALPGKLAEIITKTPAATPAAAPTEANNYGKQPAPMGQPSVAFRRSFTGV